MKKALLFGVILSALAASLSAATIRRVPGEYPSIQQAIGDCNDGDTVLVSPGVYYETINFTGKNITVTSTDPNDRGIVGYTIINADGDGTVVTFENGETNKAVLTGFTITGGVGTLDYEYDEPSFSYKVFVGAGIYCSYNASPTITRCVITRNHGPYSDTSDGASTRVIFSEGGGIYCQGYGAVISHNTIYNNSAYEGGGICAFSYATVSNNVIYNNSAGYGGGFYGGYCDLVNNTIVNNNLDKAPEWGRGGNLYAYLDYDSPGIIANNVICGAKSGGGIYLSGTAKDALRCNNVWDNLPANYGMQDPRTSDIIWGEEADWTGRMGNISEDPLFRNRAMNDFHIQPTSPCVSAGDPNSVPSQITKDIDGDPRVFALRVDIGADEHVGYVKPLANAGTDQHVLVPGAITLDGAASYFSDPNGANTYRWRQAQGAAVELSDPTVDKPTFTPSAEGWYVFELVVGDGQYTSKPDRVLVVIGNEAPVADAGPDRLWRIPGFITLDGSRSHDADPPDELTYTWKQIDGPPVQFFVITPELAANERIPPSAAYFDCNEPGIYVFELVVGDGFTTSAPDTVKIETSSFIINATPIEFPTLETPYVQYPMASGAKVVYSTGQYSDSSWAIQCYDLESGRIDTLQAQQTDTMPEMDGDLILWTTGPDGYYQPICTSIVAADVETGVVSTLRQGTNTDSYGYPALSGRKAVWLRHRDVDTENELEYVESVYDICGADLTHLAKPVHFTIAEKVGHGSPYPYQNGRQMYQEPVDISGNLVVWEADGDIYGADISDLNRIKVFPICTAAEIQSDPSISGRTVVWTDQRNDVGDIYGADISDPNNIREFEVYVSSGPQTQPDIDGSMMAYVEGTTTGSIRLCCLPRQYGAVSFGLPWSSTDSLSYYGGNPRLDGSTLVWHYSSQVQGVTFEFSYSPAEGPVVNTTTGQSFDYIQHAIDAASTGDVITVSPGTYQEKVRFNGKSVTLTSVDPQDPACRAGTVLAGSGQQVTFADGESADSILVGFTIMGGSYGIFCGGSTPTIDSCTITGCSSAGVKVWNQGNPTFVRCDITESDVGAEMWAHREKRLVLRNYATFRNCLIVGNRTVGLYSGYPTLENCTVADNRGIGVIAVQAAIANSILYFNDESAEEPVNLQVENAKSTVTYSDVQGGWEGEGNIDADPLFIAHGRWIATEDVRIPIGSGNRVATVPGTPVWSAGDYHLKSQGWAWHILQGTWLSDDVTSPCIDAGDPTAPLGQEPTVASWDPTDHHAGPNTRIDMGAYGGTAQASLAPLAPAPQP